MSRARMITASMAMFGLSVLINGGQTQESDIAFSPTIPKTWDDDAMATLEVPLADLIAFLKTL